MHTYTHTHKDIQQFLLQTYVVEHQKATANHTKTSRHPKIMIQCLSMYGKMQASGFTAMIPLISISTIQWQYLGFSSWIPLGVHLPSCYCGRRLDSGQLVGRLLTWQAIFWGGPHNYALEIRYLSFPEAQTSHSSILKWIFKRVLKTRLSPGYSQIDEERDEIFKFIHQRFPEALLCEHFSF